MSGQGVYKGVSATGLHIGGTGRAVNVAGGMTVNGTLSARAIEANSTALRIGAGSTVPAINVTGTVHMAKRVVQHMVPNRSGRILIVSSVSATTPTPFETVYGPSKAFGFSFAESLREELRGTGVSVTALLPGATNSEFHAVTPTSPRTARCCHTPGRVPRRISAPAPP